MFVPHFSIRPRGQPGIRLTARRSRRPSKQQVPVLLATARGGAPAGRVLDTASQASLLASDAVLQSDSGRAIPRYSRCLGRQHKAVNMSAGMQVRGSNYIQTVNHRHRQWKAFAGPSRVVATNVLGQLLALVSASRIGARGLPA